MRGRPNPQRSMLAIVDLEERIPRDHPLRRIKEVADAALARLSPVFDHMYAQVGRASVPPERLLKASLLIALYSVRSERAFCEELEYNLLYRWFLDMDLMERSFDATVFTKNRQRLLAHDAGRALFDEVVWAAEEEGLLSDEHFSVDGTLIEAAASLKSFRAKEGPPPPSDDDPGNPSVDFRGERRRNETHASTTDPEARLLRKGLGKEARLAFMGHALMENRNGLLMDFIVSQATGTAERDVVPELLDGVRERGYRPRTLGADRGYDTKDCVGDMRARRVTPHVARKKKHSAIDGRTTRHAGYAVSLRLRKRVEEVFGWMKTVGGFRRTRYRGVARTGLAGYLVATAYNLVRLAKLLDEPEAATGPSA
ncbi:MAG: IS5 family transposase [Caldilineaceae bacterium SB0665_bin_21]|nr:IS5 family transposase [Caldilineaceae bacterium SB0665_bin_21]